ncbi:hypothetical protein V6N13_005303 [Hibiscus sabdariffa]
MESCFGYGRDMGGDRCGSRESVPTDIIDILQLLVGLVPWNLIMVAMLETRQGLVHEGGDVSGCAPLGSDCNVVDILHSGNEDMISVDQEKEEFRDCEACSQGSGEAPHEALILALGYLGVRDLLVVENVCTSLRNIVQNDLLWGSIHIDQPLNEKLTDDALLQITKRTQGSLQCLSLVDCKRISDDPYACG